MNLDTIRRLNAATADFYTSIARDFDATRQEPWAGWNGFLPYVEKLVVTKKHLRIFDVACGNGRFGNFLADHFHNFYATYRGIDNNTFLLEKAKKGLTKKYARVELEQKDIIETIIQKKSLTEGTADILCLFGFLHHVPSQALRLQLFNELRSHLTPRGLFFFSTWQFNNQPNLFARRLSAQQAGFVDEELETGDCFLTWERGGHGVRYSHLFSLTEITTLLTESGFTLLTDYSLKSEHHFNHYFVAAVL